MRLAALRAGTPDAASCKQSLSELLATMDGVEAELRALRHALGRRTAVRCRGRVPGTGR